MKTKLSLLMSMLFTLALANPSHAQWVQARGPYYDAPPSPLAVEGDTVYVVYAMGTAERSTDGGASWEAVFQGVRGPGIVNSVALKGTTLYAGTRSGIYQIPDSGGSWTAINNGLPPVISVNALVAGPDSTGDLFAGTSRGVFVSTNSGSSWTAHDTGLTDTTVNCLLFDGAKLLAGTNSGLFTSTNSGLNWVQAGSNATKNPIWCLVSNGTGVYAGTDSGVFRSTNDGESWTPAGMSGAIIAALAFKGSVLFAGTTNGLFLSTDDGSDWSNGHLPTAVFSIAASGNDIFASGTGGVFLSTDNASTWKCLTGQTVESEYTFARSGNELFVGGQEGAFRSTDDGESWLPAGLPLKSISALATQDSSLFALANGGLYLSTNIGLSWSIVRLPITSTSNVGSPFSFVVDGKRLFISMAGDSIFSSEDHGESWTFVGSGPSDGPIESLLADPDSSNILYASSNHGMFKSSDGGATWTAINSGLTDTSITALAFSDTVLYAGTPDGVFRTSDRGESWTGEVNVLSNSYIAAFATDSTLPGRVFAGSYYGKVYMTADNSPLWTSIGDGLPQWDITALTVSGPNLVAGTNGSNVWYRPLSEVITGVNQIGNTPPSGFRLDQNYPNPFNPSTVISYQLAGAARVTLKIYDVLGREAETLVDRRQNAGNYSVRFNGAGLPSGVYFYRLEAGTFSATKKFLLLK